MTTRQDFDRLLNEMRKEEHKASIALGKLRKVIYQTKQLLDDVYNPKPVTDTGQPRYMHEYIKEIKQIICAQCGITVDDIISKSRKHEIVEAKQILVYILVRFFSNSTTINDGRNGEFTERFGKSVSYVVISQHVNAATHATVVHSCRQVKDQCETNKAYRLRLEAILSKCYELMNGRE